LNGSPSQDAPQFTQVELTGAPESVAALASRIGQEARILYDTSSPADVRGDVSRRLQVVTHQTPATGQGVRKAVTIQVVLEVDGEAWAETGAGVQEAVASALERVEGVLGVETRLVAVTVVPPVHR
jgi:hypothetical protein